MAERVAALGARLVRARAHAARWRTQITRDDRLVELAALSSFLYFFL